MTELSAPSLNDVRSARERLAGHVIRTPLLRLRLEGVPAEVYVKCENLQPVGSYKNRSQGAIMTTLEDSRVRHGVYTASSGNAGVAMADAARMRGIPARVYTPETVDAAKVRALKALGARVHALPYDDWWAITVDGGHPDDPGFYMDAVRDPRALAGNGTLGLEIVEELPDVDTIVAPFGGGGLICGMAAAVRAVRPRTRIVAAEIASARPLEAAFRGGAPVEVAVGRSFIQSIGAPMVLAAMWPLLQTLVDQVTVATAGETCEAIRTLLRRGRVVAEGAAAVGLAAVMAGRVSGDRIVCIISGGNIDPAHLAAILEGRVPLP